MSALAEKIPDVVNLGIGQPDFDTPVHIRQAATDALEEGYTRYPPSKGYLDLRRAAAEKLMYRNRIDADPESEIFISVGAMQVIFNTMLHLVDTGDEVIVVDPGYDYYSQIGLFSGIPVRVPAREENGFQVDPDDVKKAITPKTKLMIINTPSNPTGAVFDLQVLESIAHLAQKNGIFVLSDEPYEDIVYGDRKHISIGSLEGMKEWTISAFTLSKTYAMTGWRIGYCVAPQPFIDEMEKLMEHMVSGVPSMVQRAALAAITGPRDTVREMVAEYDQRRTLVHQGLNAIDGIRCLRPEATFYAFPNITGLGRTSWDFAKYLVREHHVAVVPGSIFGNNGEGYIRVSFAVDQASLNEGIKRIKNAAKALALTA